MVAGGPERLIHSACSLSEMGERCGLIVGTGGAAGLGVPVGGRVLCSGVGTSPTPLCVGARPG